MWSSRLYLSLIFVAVLALVFWFRSGTPPDGGLPGSLDISERADLEKDALLEEGATHSIVDSASFKQRSKLPETPSSVRCLLQGQVTTPDGAPIPGATLSAFASRNQRTKEFESLLNSATSLTDGTYEVPISSLIESWLTVRKPGFAAVEQRLFLSQPGIIVRDYVLSPASGRIEGLVLDVLKEKPLANAEVFLTLGRSSWDVLHRLSYRSPLAPRPEPDFSPRRVRTDSAGRFSFEEVPECRASLTSSFPSYMEDIRRVDVLSGKTSSIELRMVEVDSLSFTVMNQRREPIAMATVLRPNGLTATADRAGLVSFPLMPKSEPFELKLWAPRYLLRKLSVDPKQTPSEIFLEDGFELSGQVLSKSGLPLSGATISIWGSKLSSVGFPNWKTVNSPGPVNGIYELSVQTNERGEFSVRSMRPPIRQIHVSHPWYREKWVAFKQETSYAAVHLEPIQTELAGRVVDAKGHPVRHFMVRVRDPAASYRWVTSKTFSDANGLFSMRDLPAGRFQLDVLGWSTGEQASMEESRVVFLASGTIQNVEMTLKEKPEQR